MIGSRGGAARAFWVYILATKRNGTFYVGHTDDLARRIWEHRAEVRPGFTSKYGIKMLVWMEAHDTRDAAKIRERQVKKWNRAWKMSLIEHRNPEWRDLYLDLSKWYSADLR